jgi:hypothetical protein
MALQKGQQISDFIEEKKLWRVSTSRASGQIALRSVDIPQGRGAPSRQSTL